MIRLAVSSKIFHNETIKNERMDESTSIAMKIQTTYAMKILGYASPLGRTYILPIFLIVQWQSNVTYVARLMLNLGIKMRHTSLNDRQEIFGIVRLLRQGETNASSSTAFCQNKCNPQNSV